MFTFVIHSESIFIKDVRLRLRIFFFFKRWGTGGKGQRERERQRILNRLYILQEPDAGLDPQP